jgi:hypothetical protein
MTVPILWSKLLVLLELHHTHVQTLAQASTYIGTNLAWQLVLLHLLRKSQQLQLLSISALIHAVLINIYTGMEHVRQIVNILSQRQLQKERSSAPTNAHQVSSWTGTIIVFHPALLHSYRKLSVVQSFALPLVISQETTCIGIMNVSVHVIHLYRQ